MRPMQLIVSVILCFVASLGAPFQLQIPFMSCDKDLAPGTRFHMFVDWPEGLARRSDQTRAKYYEDAARYTGKYYGYMCTDRMIFMVLHPSFRGTGPFSHGKLWDLDSESIFVKMLSTTFNEEVDVYIYPYLDNFEDEWKADMGTETALEAVFKYVDSLNALLRAAGSDKPFVTGIVGDYTPKVVGQIPTIPALRERYTVNAKEPGQMLFALEAHRKYVSHIEYPELSIVDQWFLLMKDWAAPVDPFANEARFYPGRYLTALKRDGGFDPSLYSNKKIQFTWMTDSLNEGWGYGDLCPFPLHVIDPERYEEARSIDFRYAPARHDFWGTAVDPETQTPVKYYEPIPIWVKEQCGTSNQLGAWPPLVVKEFFQIMQQRHPEELGGLKVHGFSRFSWTPYRWHKSI